MVAIREALEHDRDAVWEIFRTVVAAGDTYVFDLEIPREEALAYWFHPGTRTYVAESEGRVVGDLYSETQSARPRFARVQRRFYGLALGSWPRHRPGYG